MPSKTFGGIAGAASVDSGSFLSAWIITRLENRAFQVGIKGVNITGILLQESAS
jgi:hypothetical protein